MKLNRVAPIMAVTLAFALTGCGDKTQSEARPAAPVEEVAPKERPEPVAEPEPAESTWEDLAGEWCSDTNGCYTVSPDIETVSWADGTRPPGESTFDSKSEYEGCFSFLLIASSGSGGATFLACMAGVPTPAVGSNGSDLGDSDATRDRIIMQAQSLDSSGIPFYRS